MACPMCDGEGCPYCGGPDRDYHTGCCTCPACDGTGQVDLGRSYGDRVTADRPLSADDEAMLRDLLSRSSPGPVTEVTPK